MTQQWCTGRLLVALPVLDDPNFARSVVFVIEHDEDGALGLVLNRPTTTPIDDILAGWSLLAAEPANLYGGGPVEPQAVVEPASSPRRARVEPRVWQGRRRTGILRFPYMYVHAFARVLACSYMF